MIEIIIKYKKVRKNLCSFSWSPLLPLTKYVTFLPDNSSSGESSSLLVMFIAVVVGFVFILTILALATRARLRHRRGHPEVKVDKNKLSTGDEG